MELQAGRIAHVREICLKSIEFDSLAENGPIAWCARHWLAQSVLNILDGNIDEQIVREIQSEPCSAASTDSSEIRSSNDEC